MTISVQKFNKNDQFAVIICQEFQNQGSKCQKVKIMRQIVILRKSQVALVKKPPYITLPGSK